MTHISSARSWILPILTFLLCTTPALPQGRTDYLNPESPQVHPIEVARVDGYDYLLVCNTPDNSVEIWDTGETRPAPERLLARVPVGLEPVSVRWHAGLDRFYAANFLGDSVTTVALSAPGGPDSLLARVDRTDYAGDEPTDVAFWAFDDGGQPRETLIVTHMTQDGYGWLDALTLQPMIPGTYLLDAVVDSGEDLDNDGDLDAIALKEPRALTVECGQLFMLGTKGGNTPKYDFDLYILDLANPAPRHLGGLGSSNFNFRFAPDGDLWAVGGEALNTTLRNEPEVAAAATGFVKHMVYRVRDACTVTPTIERRDVNSVSSPGTSSAGAPVTEAEALAQLTDVLPVMPPGGEAKVFFTAYGSDRIGVIEPVGASADWPLRRIDLRPGAEPSADTAGPRGLALKDANPDQPSDPGPRLYVLNRISHTLAVIDPEAETVIEEVALGNDPTPAYIRSGRRFLYSARFSGTGFSSCADCHVDGRSDGLAWDLGTPSNPPAEIPAELRNFPDFTSEFPADKEHMVTQTLQGLLNFEVDPESQGLVTNAPYHWRGDKPAFLDFNPAFESLLGGAQLAATEMARFEEFVNSIHYPGNPRQPATREFSGRFAGFEGTQSTGAAGGMVIFHILPTVGFVSCVHCHALPEGSNNRLTVDGGLQNPHDPQEDLAAQPTETAALRGMIQREARLSRSGADLPKDSPITGLEGMLHTGFFKDSTPGEDENGVGNVNAFIRTTFGSVLCPPEDPFCGFIQNVNQFVHELDWGVAPLVGLPYTIDQANAGAPLTATVRALMEGQAQEANVGVAIQAWIGGAARGFWYDQNAAPAVYREEPGTATFTFDQLLALLTAPDDRLVMTATPLGSERRLASPSGTTAPLTGGDPAGLELLPMATNTANVNIPKLSLNWAGAENTHGGLSAHVTRLLQHGLIASSPPGESGFGRGLTIGHDAPRRLRLAGDHIRHDARLELFTHDDPDVAAPPILGLPPEDPSQVATRKLSLPIYATGDEHGGRRVWETAVELDPEVFYRLMVGGRRAPAVAEATSDVDYQYQEPPTQITFDAAGWNWHYLRVVNADGDIGDGGWQRLRLDLGVIFADGFESGDLAAWSSSTGGP